MTAARLDPGALLAAAQRLEALGAVGAPGYFPSGTVSATPQWQ